ncbi:MAG: hypothetical protein ACF8R9_13070 [Phycisphaerales bacterium JB054]
MPDAEPPTISDPLSPDGVVVSSHLAKAEALKALERAGRRGRLPGFACLEGDAFRLDCDSIPFEHEIVARVVSGEKTAAGGCRFAMSVRRKRLMPTIFAATLILTVWPGVWLTDSLIATYWSAYGHWTESMPWLTYAWYLPIAALPLPWVWKALVTKSASMARESARAQVDAVRSELNPDPAD